MCQVSPIDSGSERAYVLSTDAELKGMVLVYVQAANCTLLCYYVGKILVSI